MMDTRLEAEALGPAGSMVLNLAPELGPWLFGPAAGPVVTAVQVTLAALTGSNDPAAQVATLVDPEKAAILRVALARIAAQEAGKQQDLAAVGSSAAGTPPVPGSLAHGAPLVSVVVLLTFAAVMMVALTRTMPSNAEPVLNVLLGTLGAMATSVVGYWVGSSAGSARKDERLASIAERG